MKIKFNSDVFGNLLTIASKFGDTCQIKIDNNQTTLLTGNTNGSTILYSVVKTDSVESPCNLNVPSINKLQKIINCVSAPLLEFGFNQNHISYNDGKVRFKYHVFDDGIISLPKINPAKIKQIPVHGSFTLPYSEITQILKLSTFTADINKVYITANDTDIHINFADNQRQNTDSAGYTAKAIQPIFGVIDQIAINVDPLRIINTIDCDKHTPVTFSINNELKIITIKIATDIVEHDILISGLANN